MEEVNTTKDDGKFLHSDTIFKKPSHNYVFLVKIDIVAENQPGDAGSSAAIPFQQVTPSTYKRVEKGTRTALLYWDGWFSAEDARLAEDPDYFTKTGNNQSAALKRNLNRKNLMELSTVNKSD